MRTITEIDIPFTEIRAGLRLSYETANREGFTGVARRVAEFLDQLDQADLTENEIHIVMRRFR